MIPSEGLGATISRLLDEHWPGCGVNGHFLADLIREQNVNPERAAALGRIARRDQLRVAAAASAVDRLSDSYRANLRRQFQEGEREAQAIVRAALAPTAAHDDGP